MKNIFIGVILLLFVIYYFSSALIISKYTLHNNNLRKELFIKDSIISRKDSIYRDHLDKCAMISKDQLKYGKDGIVYIKDIYRLTYDLSN